MNVSRPTQYRLAIVCLLFSASAWGIIWYPFRLLNEAGMSALWTTLVIYLAVAVPTIPILYRQYPVIRSHLAHLVALALAASIANVGFLVAVTEGEVMRVTLLFYLSPLWAVLLSRWWLKEDLPLVAVLMLMIALCGSAIMLWNPSMGFPWPHDSIDWLALIAGVAFAANNVLVRKMATISTTIKATLTWWGVVVISIVVLLYQQAPIPDVSATVWISTWLLGWGTIVAMTAAILYGVSHMPVYRSSIIMLFELVVAALSAWWLANEVMSGSEWLGGTLILLAGYGVVRIQSQNLSHNHKEGK